MREAIRARWMALLASGSVLAGVASAVALSSGEDSTWAVATLVGLAVAVGLASLGLLVVTHSRLAVVTSRIHDVGDQIAELQALTNLRSFVGMPLLPALGGWAVDARLAERVVELVVVSKPRLVVECGSGSSTVVIAACLRALGSGYLVSLEHQAAYRDRTMAFLELHDLLDWAEIRHAPLTRDPFGRHDLWYDPSQVEGLRLPVDLLLVDGPPGELGPQARYPAVPRLFDQLSENALVILDDGRRDDETAIAHAWNTSLQGSMEFIDCVHGAWLIRRGASP